MNAWDVFTWVMIVALAGSALVIFCFFLRDLGGILKGDGKPTDAGRAGPPGRPAS
ncbi:MAG: hypothetical protein ACE5JH_07390 [Acidobacteriota bacterium]